MKKQAGQSRAQERNSQDFDEMHNELDSLSRGGKIMLISMGRYHAVVGMSTTMPIQEDSASTFSSNAKVVHKTMCEIVVIEWGMKEYSDMSSRAIELGAVVHKIRTSYDLWNILRGLSYERQR